jgi:hypothetical protein
VTFKLTQEQTETIQAVFDKQSTKNGDYDCWEGINKQIQKQTESGIRINEEGEEEILIFYMEIRIPMPMPMPNASFSIHKMKVHRD